jgi:hypothetical protein
MWIMEQITVHLIRGSRAALISNNTIMVVPEPISDANLAHMKAFIKAAFERPDFPPAESITFKDYPEGTPDPRTIAS